MTDTPEPRFRDDLRVIRQVRHGETGYVVKDPHTLEYYRLDAFQFSICKLLDGSRDAKAVLAQVNRDLDEDARLTEADLKEFLESIDRMGFLEKTGRAKNAQLVERMKAERKSRILTAKGSLTYKRVPIVDPDAYLGKLIPYISFFWSRSFLILSLSMMALAGVVIAANWTEVAEGIRAIFAFHERSAGANLALWAMVFVIIGLHEHAHGLTCKYYGGEVHELGFLFLFFQPCMYANVSDAWTFPDKSKRLAVVLAGGYFEFWLGSIATFLWVLTSEASTLNALCYQVMTICGFSSVLFNFNPLVKLDGYYILCDLLDMPNLKGESSAYLAHLFKKHVFRMPAEDRYTRREARVYLVYGVLSTLWIVTVLTGIYFLVSGLLVGFWHEVGLLLSLVIAYKLFWPFVLKFRGFLKKLVEVHPVLRSFKVRVALAAAAVLAAAALWLPVEHAVGGEGVLEPLRSAVVRARVGGFVYEVHKHEGDRVQAGELLVRLENRSLELELEGLLLDRENLAVRLGRVAVETQGELQVTLKLRLEDLDTRIARAREDLAGLELRAPLAGVVVTPALDERVGEYLGQGRDWCEILEPGAVRVAVAVSERDVAWVKPGSLVSITLVAYPGRRLWSRVSAVVPASDDNRAGVEPTFRVLVDMQNPDGLLRPGMSGQVRIRVGERRVYEGLVDWLGRTMKTDLLMF